MTVHDARQSAKTYLIAKFALWWARLLNIRKLPTESLQLGISFATFFIGASLLLGNHGVTLDPYVRTLQRSWPGLTPLAIGWLMVMISSFSFAAYLDANGDMAMIMMVICGAVWAYYGGVLWLAFPPHIAPKLFVCIGLISLGVSGALAMLDGKGEYAAAPIETPEKPKEAPVVRARIIFKQ